MPSVIGGDRIEPFRPSLASARTVAEDPMDQVILSTALDRNEMRCDVVFQPIVGSARIVMIKGFEALARWTHRSKRGSRSALRIHSSG